jgi:carbonic anhydrase/acetyltransferase-like protein (isoleucine patch superfamily)
MKSADNKNIYRFALEAPQYGLRVMVHDQAFVSGSVVLGDDVSVWPMAVIRGDVNHIDIGARSNIQDGAVLHVSREGDALPDGMPLHIAQDVTIGHGAILHGCTIGNLCLVGMGAIILDGAVLEDECMVAAGAVVTPGTRVTAGTLWRGNPARQARPLRGDELEMLADAAKSYLRLKNIMLAQKQ